jgi:hypothetical protein
LTAGRQVISQSQEWCTPPKYVEAILEVFGKRVDLDPCSNTYSIVNAKTEFKLPKNDGIEEEWDFQTIYVNPPYGRAKNAKHSIYHWLEKCKNAHYDFGSEVLALIPVAPNTKHWKDNIFGQATAVCFLADTRLKFLVNGSIDNKGAPMSCCMVYWGSDLRRFQEVFTEFGAVVPVKNSYKVTQRGLG